jgi:shikimate kinase
MCGACEFQAPTQDYQLLAGGGGTYLFSSARQFVNQVTVVVWARSEHSEMLPMELMSGDGDVRPGRPGKSS